MSDPLLVLAAGTAALFLLILCHVPVGASMAVVGVVGFGLLVSFGPAFSTVALESVSALGSVDLATIPLFLLMGSLASRCGLSGDIYALASRLIGHYRGGLAGATVVACAGFGALCGSSLATTATMARIALPEMTRRGYATHLAAGSIAGGGSLGILIPPSIIMVVYAFLTEQFVLDLFVAGILPGILSVLLYGLAIRVAVALRPQDGPAFARAGWAETGRAALRAWRALVTVLLVIGSIYAGIFTVLEAASFGVAVTFLFFVLRCRGESPGRFADACLETARSTGLIFLMVIGANIFSYFLSVSGGTEELVGLVSTSGLPDWAILVGILLMYLVLGAVFDTVAAMVLTLPFVFPLIVGMGYDPIWWGIVNVMIIEIGLITPPIGLNAFIMHGMAPHIPLKTIYRGILPFFCADIVRIALIVAFPAIALALVR